MVVCLAGEVVVLGYGWVVVYIVVSILKGSALVLCHQMMCSSVSVS